LLTRMIDEQIVRVVELEGEALQMFFGLVSGSASQSLGDGEAATLAFAHGMGCTAAIDEKKATRLAADRFGSLRLVTTVDILAHDAVRTSVGDGLLADATFQALWVARSMHPILTALSVLAERRRYDLKDVLKIR